MFSTNISSHDAIMYVFNTYLMQILMTNYKMFKFAASKLFSKSRRWVEITREREQGVNDYLICFTPLKRGIAVHFSHATYTGVKTDKKKAVNIYLFCPY